MSWKKIAIVSGILAYSAFVASVVLLGLTIVFMFSERLDAIYYCGATFFCFLFFVACLGTLNLAQIMLEAERLSAACLDQRRPCDI